MFIHMFTYTSVRKPKIVAHYHFAISHRVHKWIIVTKLFEAAQ